MYNLSDDSEFDVSLSRSQLSSEKTSKSKFYSPQDLLTLEDPYLQSLPQYLLDGSVGIDGLTVSLALDEDSIDLAEFLANLIGKGNKTKGAVSLPNMPSPWVFWPSTDIRQRLKVNFNPSNFSRVDGFEICPPPLLFYYVELALKTILCKGDPGARPQFMADNPYGMVSPWPRSWPKEIEVFQAHYARDLIISESTFSMETLQDTKPKYAKATLSYRNDGVIETISHPHSKKVAKHSFYDKYRERERLLRSKKKYKDFYKAVPKGTKRYEVQIPRADLRRFHHETLDVFTTERIHKALKRYWELSNYGLFVDIQLNE